MCWSAGLKPGYLSCISDSPELQRLDQHLCKRGCNKNSAGIFNSCFPRCLTLQPSGSLSVLSPWLFFALDSLGCGRGFVRIVVSSSPEARDIAGQSRDPGTLPHSCVRPDMLPLLSLAVEASFCEFSSKTGALSAKSGPAENSRSVVSEAS